MKTRGKRVSRKRLKGFLSAEVKKRVWFYVEDGFCVVKQKIVSVNKTGETLSLHDGPYRLPVRKAQKVKAFDAEGRLTAHGNNDCIEVTFRDGKALSPDEEYKWAVSYEIPTSSLVKKNNGRNMFRVRYRLKPQDSYKGVPIPTHTFVDCQFIFMYPKSKVWRVIKFYDVTQDNNKEFSTYRPEVKSGRTVLTFKRFDLERHRDLVIDIDSKTRYRRYVTIIKNVVPVLFAVVVDFVSDVVRKFIGLG